MVALLHCASAGGRYPYRLQRWNNALMVRDINLDRSWYTIKSTRGGSFVAAPTAIDTT